ncbi:glycosyl transferase [Achromobacter insolitus]|uniref:glycosyltransferase n=1 Tax=Achromobacter insolitus TaxID=217204 RepID=UPI0007C70F04|nr:glycosyltransferase [Achromobacter insolitus]OAE62530.1 glycosyl transferase [Achromobacter insolitus]OCZ58184.1 glycosyl transferase [Achromobacter insolitus]
MIGICIPAHDEEDCIAACLRAATRAARHPRLHAEAVRIVVVLDHCADRTAALSAAWPVHCLSIRARNVGAARAAGAQHLLNAGARWLAFTDADTRVSAGWLVAQLSLGAEVVCGTVGVSGWGAHGAHASSARKRFAQRYQDRDGHRHVHGANLGIEADAYRRIGGFAALACSEDQALVDRLEQDGARIAWSCLPRVTTSARPYSRVEGGFASALRQGWASPP